MYYPYEVVEKRDLISHTDSTLILPPVVTCQPLTYDYGIRCQDLCSVFHGDRAGRGIHLTAGTKMFPPLPILKLHPCSFHSYLNNMAEKSQKFKSEVWNFFKVVEGGDKTKCNFCDVTWSYKSNSTKSM